MSVARIIAYPLLTAKRVARQPCAGVQLLKTCPPPCSRFPAGTLWRRYYSGLLPQYHRRRSCDRVKCAAYCMNADCAGGDATPCIPVRPTDRPTADSTGQAPTPASRWVREGFAQSSLPPSLWQRQRSQGIRGDKSPAVLTPKPRPCPPCPLECFALAVRQRSGISRGIGEAGTSKPTACPCSCWRWVRARGKGATGLGASLTCPCADMLQILELPRLCP